MFIIERFINLIIAIVLFYIFFKFIAPNLKKFLIEDILGHKLNDPTNDLDEMIRKKKEHLRKAGLASEISGGKIAPRSFYQEILSDHESNTEEKENAKQIMAILEELQWGSGEELKKWTLRISNKILRNLDRNEVNTRVAHALDSFPSPVHIKKLKRYLVFYFLIKEISEKKSPLAIKTCKKTKISHQSLLVALNLTITAYVHSQKFTDLMKQGNHRTTSSPEQIDEYAYHLAQTEEIKTNEWLEDIITKSQLLIPIIEIKEDLSNYEQALKFSGLTQEQVNKEKVNQVFKKLQKMYHPDTIAKHKLDSSLEKIATKNYQMILVAKETIIKKI